MITIRQPEFLLRSLTEDDAESILTLLDAERDAFDPWLRWSAAVRTIDDARAFIAGAAQRENAGNGFHLGIVHDGELVGGAVCWSINGSGAAEIGYWVRSASRRLGLAENASRALIAHLAGMGVRRIELQCLVDNIPSRRLAERLGAHLVRTYTPDVRVNGRSSEHALYAIELCTDNETLADPAERH